MYLYVSLLQNITLYNEMCLNYVKYSYYIFFFAY